MGVLISFIAVHLLGMNSNLMGLRGIAIMIGTMVDAAIAMLDPCRRVGPAPFFSLPIITVSFLPVFTLESREERLF